jgi:vacuolar-type H+-ATPase subunit I/STV1
MVQQMAEALWLSRRSMRLQNDCFAVFESGAPEEQRAAHKSLALYLRYQTTHDRTYSRYATELRKRRNERARAERGFVSQQYKKAAERRRNERHAMQQSLQNLKQEAQQIRNRIAAAKAEAFELKNIAKKAAVPAENSDVAIAAAA